LKLKHHPVARRRPAILVPVPVHSLEVSLESQGEAAKHQQILEVTQRQLQEEEKRKPMLPTCRLKHWYHLEAAESSREMA
jgi:hypothetical protein